MLIMYFDFIPCCLPDSTHHVELVSSASSDPLLIPSGPIIRAHAKRFKEALNGLIKDIWAKSLQFSRRIVYYSSNYGGLFGLKTLQLSCLGLGQYMGGFVWT